MNFRDLEERYLKDAEFKMFVDLLENMIFKLKFAPSEIKEAAVFACIVNERRHPAKQVIGPTNELNPWEFKR